MTDVSPGSCLCFGMRPGAELCPGCVRLLDDGAPSGPNPALTNCTRTAGTWRTPPPAVTSTVAWSQELCPGPATCLPRRPCSTTRSPGPAWSRPVCPAGRSGGRPWVAYTVPLLGKRAGHSAAQRGGRLRVVPVLRYAARGGRGPGRIRAGGCVGTTRGTALFQILRTNTGLSGRGAAATAPLTDRGGGIRPRGRPQGTGQARAGLPAPVQGSPPAPIRTAGGASVRRCLGVSLGGGSPSRARTVSVGDGNGNSQAEAGFWDRSALCRGNGTSGHRWQPAPVMPGHGPGHHRGTPPGPGKHRATRPGPASPRPPGRRPPGPVRAQVHAAQACCHSALWQHAVVARWPRRARAANGTTAMTAPTSPGPDRPALRATTARFISVLYQRAALPCRYAPDAVGDSRAGIRHAWRMGQLMAWRVPLIRQFWQAAQLASRPGSGEAQGGGAGLGMVSRQLLPSARSASSRTVKAASLSLVMSGCRCWDGGRPRRAGQPLSSRYEVWVGI
ncbi:hypothetical protein ABH941_007798 [Streptacidiphilus sp. EB103A]